MWHNRMAREGGLLEELLMEYACRSPLADNRRIWDLILREWCEREANLELYLNARLDHAVSRENRILSAQFTQTTTETTFELTAPIFIDATGDAFLADAVGAEYRKGREGRDEFGESLAPEQADSRTLPSALYMIAHRRSCPAPFTRPDWVPKHLGCDAFPHRPHVIDKFAKGKALTEDGSAIQLFWWCSLGGERDTIKDNELIYKDLVKEAMGIWDHLKNHCTAETRQALANYEAVWWSPFPLRRESRRVVGDHMLIESDIFQPKLFDDRVSYGGWPVDVHPPEGLYSKEPPCDQTFVNELYSVPFGMMYSRNIENLLLAGRCISASHVALGSIRVMNSLGAAAQAAGMAAALCVDHKVGPRAIRADHMKQLQQELLKADLHIIRLPNEDPGDLARESSVSATSELPYRSDQHEDYVELVYDLAQQLPVSGDQIDSISIPLKSERQEDCSVRIRLFQSNQLGRFSNKTALLDQTVTVKARSESWIDVQVNTEITPKSLLWICVDRQPGVFWGFSGQEAFGTRFSVRFEGELSPRPSHGKARIAPVEDDWFPINHNGRLPQELHDWVDQKIGMQYDRKVRATLCHRIAPETRPYSGPSVINGVSRAEDWPNVWISDRSQSLPQSLTLRWDKPQEIGEVRLTFDTDLDAPDRCYGWPREEHRFPFPVPQCVRGYRVLAHDGDQTTELLRVDDNYHRRRIHRLDSPIQADAIQIEVLSTHGSEEARVNEVRVY